MSDDVELIRPPPHHARVMSGSMVSVVSRPDTAMSGRSDEEYNHTAAAPGTGTGTGTGGTPGHQRRSTRYQLHSRQSTMQRMAAWKRTMREWRNNIQLFVRGQLVLDPNGDFRRGWDLLQVVCVVYNVVTVPWYISFDPTLAVTYLPIDVVLLLVMSIDMLFVFRTGFAAFGDQLIFDSSLVARRYMTSSKFTLDVLSILPIEFLAWGLPRVHTDDHYTAVEWWYAVLKVHQLLRLHKILANTRLDDYFQTPKLRVMKVFMLWTLMAHYIACLLVFVGLNQKNGHTYNWMIASGMDPANDSASTLYIAALYWATITLSSVGYGDKRAVTTAEQSIGLVILISAILFYAGIFSSISAALSSFQFQSRSYQKSIDSTKEFSAVNGLPFNLAQKMTRYEQNRWNQNHGFSTQEILGHLPLSVQSEVLLFIHCSLVEKVPFFQQCSSKFLDSFILRLKPPSILLSGDYLFREGDSACRSLYFIKSGSFAITQENPISHQEDFLGEINERSQAPFFGELSLLLGIPRTATIQASATSASTSTTASSNTSASNHGVYNELTSEDFFDLYSQFPEEVESMLKPHVLSRLNQDYTRAKQAAERRAAGGGAIGRRNALTTVMALGVQLAARLRIIEKGQWIDRGHLDGVGGMAGGTGVDGQQTDPNDDGMSDRETDTSTTATTMNTQTRRNGGLRRYFSSADRPSSPPVASPSVGVGDNGVAATVPFQFPAPSPSLMSLVRGESDQLSGGASTTLLAPMPLYPHQHQQQQQIQLPGTIVDDVEEDRSKPIQSRRAQVQEESKDSAPFSLNHTPPLMPRAVFIPGSPTDLVNTPPAGKRSSRTLLPVLEDRAVGSRHSRQFSKGSLRSNLFMEQPNPMPAATIPSDDSIRQPAAAAGVARNRLSSPGPMTSVPEASLVSIHPITASQQFDAPSPTSVSRRTLMAASRRRSMGALSEVAEAAVGEGTNESTLPSDSSSPAIRDTRRSTGRAELLLRLQSSGSTRDLIADSVARQAEEQLEAGVEPSEKLVRQASVGRMSAAFLRQISLPLGTPFEESTDSPLKSSSVPATPAPTQSTARRVTLNAEKEDQLDVLAQLRSKRDSAIKRATLETAGDEVSSVGLFASIQASLHDQPASAQDSPPSVSILMPPVAVELATRQMRKSPHASSTATSPNTSQPSSAKQKQTVLGHPPAATATPKSKNATPSVTANQKATSKRSATVQPARKPMR